MGTVFSLADRFVEDLAAIDPLVGTFLGIPGHEDELTDYSPKGVADQTDVERRAIATLRESQPENDRERVCRDLMLERLGVDLELDDAGEPWRALRTIHSPVQSIPLAFEIAPRTTDDDWGHLAAKMTQVPGTLAGFIESLKEGLRRGMPAARRQALACADQAATIGGLEGTASPYFMDLAKGCPVESLAVPFETAARAATAAYASLAAYLRNDYAPLAEDRDAVGRERYALMARRALGCELDLDATYRWGCEELRRLDAELERLAGRMLPGASAAGVIQLLRTDRTRAIEGPENLIAFLQERVDQALADLDGVHFDIPEQLRRCECVVAPPGRSGAMYYVAPTEDFSRPGRVCYPTMGRTLFPLWTEVSVAHHEGVPGHHLERGLVRCLGGELSRYQRTLASVSGHAEGWALYAERLMAELGYLEKPDYQLGMLLSQAFRAVRVVVDIGLHLELPIPPGYEGAGEIWSPPLALALADRYSPYPGEFTRGEIDRYLGFPGQAISYKVGEREWLAVREDVRRAEGAAFDLKAFHNRALRLGPVGLAQLRQEMLPQPV